MILIPHPIPLPERAQLIAAGKEACNQSAASNARREAHQNVCEIVETITKRYGKEYPDE